MMGKKYKIVSEVTNIYFTNLAMVKDYIKQQQDYGLGKMVYEKVSPASRYTLKIFSILVM